MIGVVFTALAAGAFAVAFYTVLAAPTPAAFAYTTAPLAVLSGLAWIAWRTRAELAAARDLAEANEREDHIGRR